MLIPNLGTSISKVPAAKAARNLNSSLPFLSNKRARFTHHGAYHNVLYHHVASGLTDDNCGGTVDNGIQRRECGGHGGQELRRNSLRSPSRKPSAHNRDEL